MQFLKNFKIRQVLVGSVAIVITVLLMSGTLNHIKMGEIVDNVETQKREILPNYIDLLDLQLNIIQIQQWLTDVSATRAAEGFDDGYDEAKNYFDKANQNIERLTNMYTKLGKSHMVSELKIYKQDTKFQNIKIHLHTKDVKSFYELGNQIKMVMI